MSRAAAVQTGGTHTLTGQLTEQRRLRVDDFLPIVYAALAPLLLIPAQPWGERPVTDFGEVGAIQGIGLCNTANV